jgi:GNAT superfamily N-acetyltransferase
MQVNIRAAVAGDAGALALAGQATFLETYAQVLPMSDILAHCAHEHAAHRYAEWLAAPDHALWVAELVGTGAVVGYVMLCPPDLPVPLEPTDLEIRRIYLLSHFHGGGVGARLMAAALDAAREAGAKRVLLGVYEGNTTAMSFYARQGFAEAGVRKFQVGANAYDDLVLARGL